MGKVAVQINDNPAFQRRFWVVQRLVWVALTIVVILALAGLTGGGGRFTQGTVGDHTFTLSYPVLARRDAAAQVTITVAGPRDAARVHVEQAFLNRFHITDMSPAPTDVAATPWGQSYRFALTGDGLRSIRLTIVPQGAGRTDYAIVVDGHMALLSTLVLP